MAGFLNDLPTLSTNTLPYDFPPQQKTTTFSPSRSADLYALLPLTLAVNNNVSLENILIASLGVLLHRYSSETDFVIGIARSRGSSFTILPFSLSIDGLQSFRNLNGIVNSLASSPGYTVSDLKEITGKFKHLIVVSDAPVSCLNASAIDLDCDLFIWIHDIIVTMGVSKTLFADTTCVQLAKHYQAIFTSVSDNDTTAVNDIVFMDDEEIKVLLDNTNIIDYKNQTGSYVDIFEAICAAHPERTAVVDHETSLSFHELYSKATCVAAYLHQSSIGIGDFVIVSMDRSASFIISVLGVLMAGATFLPLDPSYPVERFEYIRNDSRAKAIISTRLFVEKLSIYDNVYYVDDMVDKNVVSSFKKVIIGRQNIAYCIYTSGTTGRPKGCLQTHANVVNLVSWARDVYHQPSVCSFLCSISFDASLMEYICPLSWGATVICVRDTERLDSQALFQKIQSHRIEAMFFPTSLWELYAKENWGDLQSVKVVAVGGDVLSFGGPPKLGGEFRVINMYGPTETTVVAIIHETTPDEVLPPIGKPVPNTYAYVLDRNMRPVPQGCVGELVIGGAQVGAGYLHLKDLTDKRYIVDPFSGGLMYMTGDLVRRRYDGQLAFSSRLDNQVKIRGYRVELGDIESAMLESGLVRQCLVRAIGAEKDLRAWVVAKVASTFSAKAFKETLSRRLPSYMIPSMIVSVEEFPLNAHGKIDFVTLQSFKSSQGAPMSSPARIPTNSRCLEIFRQIFKDDNLESDASPWKLLQQNHHVPIQELVKELSSLRQRHFNCSDLLSVSQIAQLDGMPRTDDAQSPLDSYAHHKYDISPIQMSLLLAQMVNPENAMYNIPLPVEIDKFAGKHTTLDMDVLKQCVNLVSYRHLILRTRYIFESETGAPKQAIDLSSEIPFRIQLLKSKPSLDDPKITEIAAKESWKPFDLSREFPLRVIVFAEDDVDSEKVLLLFVFHHIAVDGWSVPLFFDEIRESYKSLINKKPCTLPTLPCQYADFSNWILDKNQTEEFQRKLQYWKSRLLTTPEPIKLPYDFSRPSKPAHVGKTLNFKLPPDVSFHLHELRKSLHVSLNHIFLAAYALMLRIHSGQLNVSIGTVVANRLLPEFEALIGMFANTVVMRFMDMNEEKTFKEFILETQHLSIEALENQDVPLSAVVDSLSESSRRTERGRHPLFDVFYIYQNNKKSCFEIDSHGEEQAGYMYGRLRMRDLQLQNPTVKFDIAFTVSEVNDDFHFDFEYSTELFREETIVNMANTLQVLIKDAVKDPNMQLKTWTKITPEPSQLPISNIQDHSGEGLEREVISVLCSVLGESSIDLSLNFFDNGGNSLKGMQLAQSIRTHFNCEMPISMIFDSVSCQSLVEFVVERYHGTSPSRVESRQPPSRHSSVNNTIVTPVLHSQSANSSVETNTREEFQNMLVKVLETDQPNFDVDFLENGGNSLSAIRFSQLSGLSVQDILGGHTIEDLYRRYSGAKHPSKNAQHSLDLLKLHATHTSTVSSLALLKKVLKLESIDEENTDFFGAGGNSLLGMSFVQLVKSELGIAVPIDKVFSANSIKELVSYIDNDLPRGSASSVTTVASREHIRRGNSETSNSRSPSLGPKLLSPIPKRATPLSLARLPSPNRAINSSPSAHLSISPLLLPSVRHSEKPLPLASPTTIFRKPSPSVMSSSSEWSLTTRVVNHGGNHVQEFDEYSLNDQNRIQSVVDRSDESKLYPLSSFQQSMWFSYQNDAQNSVYCMPFAYRLPAVNLEVLTIALDILTQRHLILRTRYVEDDEGACKQRIDLSGKINVQHETLESDGGSSDEAILSSLSKLAWVPINLEETSAIFKIVDCSQRRNRNFGMVLLIVIHHIAFDGLSMGILWNELSTIYFSLLRDRKVRLPPTRYQYVDFAAYQSALMKRQEFQRHVNYWDEKLGGELPIIQLPYDFLRPRSPSMKGSVAEFEFGAELSAKLIEFSRHSRVTLNQLFMAAFVGFLFQYTDQDDIIVGTAVANRPPEFSDCIGMFVNSLPLRFSIPSKMTFADLVALSKATSIEALEHKDVPFSALASKIKQKSASLHPIFQVMFLFSTDSDFVDSNDMFLGEALKMDSVSSHFDLSLHIHVVENREPSSSSVVWGSFEYATDLFADETMERMSRHFRVFVENALSQSTLPIASLDLLDQGEFEKQIMEWNNTEVSYASDKCLHELMEEVALKHSDRVAVIDGVEQMTYSQLHSQANHLSRYLTSLGIKANDIVIVSLPRSISFLVGVIGVLKSGAAFLPLDHASAPERFRYIVKDSKAKYVIASSALAEKFEDLKDKILDINSMTESSAEVEAQFESVKCKVTDLAYVIYTSGTTGRPKGVCIAHRNIVNALQWFKREHALTCEDRLTQLISISFDPSLLEYGSSLITGSTLILISDDLRISPMEFIEYLGKQKTTVVNFPTALWELYAIYDWSKLCSTVRVIQVGGDCLPSGPNANEHFKLVNAYGPSECTICTIAHVCVPSENSPPIGKSIANTKVYILNSEMKPCPVGVSGEIYISGQNVGLGYLGRDDLNAEHFLPDPFVHGQIMFKTGDMARWRKDGEILFIGRKDHQVKIRGYRIELSEIESVLQEHPDVRESLVRVDAQEKSKRIVAYLVPRDEKIGVSLDKLKSFLREKLPDYMLPQAVGIVKNAFPLTLNGKVDFTRLPPTTPFTTGAAADAATVNNESAQDAVPSQKAENILAVIRKVIQNNGIGMNDNIFSSGADSLQAAQLVSKLRMELGVNLGIRDVFENPSAVSLSVLLFNNDVADGKTGGTQSLILRKEFDNELPEIPYFVFKGISKYLAQLFGVFLVSIFTLSSMAPGYACVLLVFERFGFVASFVALPLFFLFGMLTSLVLTSFAKWSLIGIYKPGTYPLWGTYHFRWWIVDNIVRNSQLYTRWLRGTFMLPIWLRCLGAKIGNGVVLRSDMITEFDLVEIENDTFIGTAASISPAIIENGALTLKPIRIGAHCDLGARVYIGSGVTIENWVTVAPLSVASYSIHLSSYTVWEGAPILLKYDLRHNRPSLRIAEEPNKWIQGFVLFSVICLTGFSLIPTALFAMQMFDFGFFVVIVTSQVGMLLASTSYAIVAGLLKRLIVYFDDSKHSNDSADGRGKSYWYFDILFNSPQMSSFLGTFAGSSVMTWYYRLIGARIGKETFLNISPESFGSLHNVTIGSNAVFGGDTLIVGGPVNVGNKSFVGDHSVLTSHSTIEANVIVGSLTRIQKDDNFTSGSIWVGNPPVLLKQSAVEESGDPKEIQEEPRKSIIILEVLIELGKLLGPSTLFAICITPVFIIGSLLLDKVGHFWILLAVAPAGYLLFCAVLFVVMILTKWLLIGKFNEAAYPMFGRKFSAWNVFSSLNGFANGLVIDGLRGTSFITLYFRLMGAKVGKNVYLNSLATNEFDLLRIGDRVVINSNASLTAHSLERGMIAFGNIEIENDATIGPFSVLLPKVHVEANTIIGPGTLCMKSETFPSNMYFEGSPAEGKSIDRGDVREIEIVSENLLINETPVLMMPRRKSTQNVFLTGGTGFIGAFLLQQFLDDEDTIFCLVRAVDEKEGLDRIRANLNAYGLWKEHYEWSIVPVVGDLSKPYFGLSEDAFHHLANKLDLIVHNAALVHFMKTYEELYDTNVRGTEYVIKLASSSGTPTPVHFISTLSVFNAVAGGHGRIREDSIPNGRSLGEPYARSKYVAEKLMFFAQERGLPISIFRLGRISGSSLTGATHTNDFFYLFLKGVVELNAYPIDLHLPIDLLPVDYCSKMIKLLIKYHPSSSKVYHLLHPGSVDIQVIWSLLSRYGYPLQGLVYSQWREKMKRTESTLTYLESFFGEDPRNQDSCVFSCKKTMHKVRDAGFSLWIPDIDEKIMVTYLDYLVETKFLPSPATNL